MIKKEIKIINKQGIHARPAGLISRTASQFESEIKIIKEGYEVNAKSIMGLLTLAAAYGTSVTVIACGKDEKEAAEALEKIFAAGFDE
ncbi:MAG: HPr family phosphocarrier protein [Elusimicrobia bacterium]|nr:HPr family phosphocarrier protein [Elusimicrobiota bacterium]